jgi:hypothetical protein
MRTRTLSKVGGLRRSQGPTGGGTAPAATTPLTLFGANTVAWWDFSNVATLSMDSAGATPVTADGDLIGRAADLSASAAHVTRAATTNRPTWRVGVQNGRACAEYDGSDDYLRNTTFAVSQPYTVFVVGRKTSGTTVNGVLMDSNAAVQAALYVGDHPTNTPSRLRANYGVALPFDTNPTTPFTSWGTASVVANGASSRIRANGGSETTGSFGTDAMSGVRLGQIRFDLAPGYFWTGYIGEAFIVNLALTTAQIQSGEAYLRAKWGTP